MLFNLSPIWAINEFVYNNEISMMKVLGLDKDVDEINEYTVPVFNNVEKIEKAGQQTRKAKAGGRRLNKTRKVYRN